MAGICAVKHNDCLYVFDEIMLTGGATTWDFAEEVTRRYGVDRRVIACPDPTVVQERQVELVQQTIQSSEGLDLLL